MKWIQIHSLWNCSFMAKNCLIMQESFNGKARRWGGSGCALHSDVETCYKPMWTGNRLEKLQRAADLLLTGKNWGQKSEKKIDCFLAHWAQLISQSVLQTGNCLGLYQASISLNYLQCSEAWVKFNPWLICYMDDTHVLWRFSSGMHGIQIIKGTCCILI